MIHMLRHNVPPQIQAQLDLLRNTKIAHDTDPAGFAVEAFMREISKYWQDHLRDGYTIDELLTVDFDIAINLLTEWKEALLAANDQIQALEMQSPPCSPRTAIDFGSSIVDTQRYSVNVPGLNR